MKKIVIVIFFSFLFNAFLFGQEKNGVSELRWINKVETDAEKFYENGTRICYLNIYGEIPETYVQSIANQVLANSGVLRFHLYYGKEHSRCMCETKDDFTNEQLAIILDEIIDKYYESGTYLLDKEKFEQEQKMAEMKLSASSKTNVDEEMYLEDLAKKAEEAVARKKNENSNSKRAFKKSDYNGKFYRVAFKLEDTPNLDNVKSATILLKEKGNFEDIFINDNIHFELSSKEPISADFVIQVFEEFGLKIEEEFIK